MTARTSSRKTKRLSKGQRTQVCSLKQVARKAGAAYKPPINMSRAAGTPKKDEQPSQAR